MAFILKWALKTVLGRWVTGFLVVSLLGGAALKWHSHKEGLIEQGVQECVQEINEETVRALEDALVDAEFARAALTASLVAAARVNQEAVARKNEAEASLSDMRRQMEKQKNEDEEYRDWSGTTLPDGVADRLRQAAQRQTGSPD